MPLDSPAIREIEIKLGNIIKFIPHPVIVGFTSGIAVIIFVSEWKKNKVWIWERLTGYRVNLLDDNWALVVMPGQKN